MKKLVFIMPLMAISLLANCGGGGKPASIERTISFNIPGCKMYYGETEITSGGTKIELPIANPCYVKFSVKTNEDNYKKPSGVTLDTTTDYYFYKEYGDLYINLQSDIAVTGTCDLYKTLEECAWAGISAASKAGVADEAYAVGQTKTVMVNNQLHKARIIGFNQDIDKDGNEIGITFEFANLISDNQGYSIGTQWNDDNDTHDDTSTANHNYLDSSIRKALTNEGQGRILWAQKGAEVWSTNPNYDGKSVLEMLPSELTEVLVAPKKTVQCNESRIWTDTPIVNNNGEYDKLFLLSLEEMGYNSTREGAYTYYQEKDETKLNSLRIKKQVYGTIRYIDSIEISDITRQIYQGVVFNAAGYNSQVDETGGGFAWFRAPVLETNSCAWNISDDGTILYSNTMLSAAPVAPAFCI